MTKKIWLTLQIISAIHHYASPEKPLSARELEKRYHLNKRALEPILQPLVKAGILISLSGNQGGYYVRNQASFADIIIGLHPSSKSLRTTTDDFEPILLELTQSLHDQFLKAAKDITLEQVSMDADKHGISRQWMEYEDYVI